MADEHDLIVIGMGVGGEEVAGSCTKAGMDVLAIERKLVGGECPYWGCIPSKVMVRAGDSLAEAARATGLAGETKISPDWAPVAARVREVTADWNDEAAVERIEKQGATFVRGTARISGPRAVEVDDTTFRARRGIVIATGSAPSVPPIDGIGDVDYWTNREAIEARELPESVVVLGAGAVGVELAQVFRRFGAEVSIIEVADHSLPMEEPENGEALDAALRGESIKLHLGASAELVRAESGGVAVELSDGTVVEGDRLLVATGRKSDLAVLGIGALGLDESEKAIPVDEHLRAGDGVWAIGDVTGKGAFTHMAVYQGRIAAADALGRDYPAADYSAVPRVTFTDPEVAGVGLTEAQARERGVDVKVGTAKTSSSARGWIHGPGAEHGVIKLVADKGRGVLVGGSVMGPTAGEMIGFVGLAIRQRIPVSDLRQLIYPYPTFVRGLEDALRELGDL